MTWSDGDGVVGLHPAAAELVDRGLRVGFLTVREIMGRLEESNAEPEALDQMLAVLRYEGLEIREDSSEAFFGGFWSGAGEQLFPEDVWEYVMEVRQFPVLPMEQQLALVKEIEAGIVAQDKLANAEELPAGELKALERVKELGVQARESPVLGNRWLVVAMAVKFFGRGLGMMDRSHKGNRALMRAVDTFNLHFGLAFSSYASWWIRAAMTREDGGEGGSAGVREPRRPIPTTGSSPMSLPDTSQDRPELSTAPPNPTISAPYISALLSALSYQRVRVWVAAGSSTVSKPMAS